MERDSNRSVKPSKKGNIVSIVFAVLAGILLVTAIVSLGACHKNISLQLEQGVPVQGNELAIVNLYLTSCVQYIALAAAMAFCSFTVRKLSAVKNEMPIRPSSICLTHRQIFRTLFLQRRMRQRKTMWI